MSFIESSAKELGNPVELLFRRPGVDKSPVPKQLILSSSVQFNFIDPSDGKEILLLQADSIAKTKKFVERKNFKPFGYSSNIVLTRDEGWEIRITGKKTDSILNSLIYAQEQYLIGTSPVSPNLSINPVGLKPEFNIRERIFYLPNSKGEPSSTEEYLYKNVSIVGYEEGFEDNASPITFALACFCPYRELVSGPRESVEIFDSVDNIINGLLKLNKQ